MERITKKEKLIKEILKYVPDRYEEYVKKAINHIAIIHNGQKRYSGEDFEIHCLNVALNTAKLKMDTDSIIAAILHQCVTPRLIKSEHMESVKNDIVREYGTNVLYLVEQVESVNMATKYNKEVNTNVLNRYLLGSSNDIRPLLIKICDTLDDLRTIEALPKEKQNGFCRKVLDVYSPISEYLNLSKIKKELDEKALQIIQPEMYETINNLLERNNINENLIEEYIEYLSILVDILGYKPKIIGRMKSRYSIYQKLSKYLKEGKGTNLKSIMDILAFSIITQNEKDCYEISNAIKSLTEEDPTLFDDYISKPKPNGYRALQINTIIPEVSELSIEVQVLTLEMYDFNTYGPASHIAYKASKSRFAKKTDKLDWVEDIHKSINKHINERESKRSIPIDGSVFNNSLFAFTPQGLILELEKESSIIDFAYRIHTNIGHSAISAKVNGKPAPLISTLRSGDVVEVITQRGKSNPDPDWLNHIKSSSTRHKILLKLKKTINLD